MAGLGTQSVIERAELVTPRLRVRAPRFYPNNPARQRLATGREPSVAWFRGDPGCEAYTGSEQAA